MYDVKVLKLGLDLYSGASSDKNGGLFEYNLVKGKILDIVDKFKSNIKENILFVVNGSADEQAQKQILEDYAGYKKVFIATDFFAFDKNKMMIENCDIILHQSMTNKLPMDLKAKSVFSCIPFLFYHYPSEKAIKSQNNRMIFGGANTGRDDKFKEYINPDTEAYLDAFTKIYNEDGSIKFDKRIPYDKFMERFEDYSYALMITRREYTDYQWFTPRFVEAVSNWALPIIDYDFPVPAEMYTCKHMATLNRNCMIKNIMYFNNNLEEKDKMLSYLSSYILSMQAKFDWLIYSIISGLENNTIDIYNNNFICL